MSLSKLFGSGKPDITVEPSFDAKPPLYYCFPSALEPGSQAPKTTTLTGRLRVTLKKTERIVEMYTTLTPRWFVRNKREVFSLRKTEAYAYTESLLLILKTTRTKEVCLATHAGYKLLIPNLKLDLMSRCSRSM
jgi:hypothetical protein